MPVPRLADHLDTTDGPSDEEGEKDAKRQRSEPTTPISTSSRPPHEYDEVMGITQVEPREAERFEEGIEPEFQDAEEHKIEDSETGDRVSGVWGDLAVLLLQECLDRINQSRTDAPATCHSGVGVEDPPSPPQTHSHTHRLLVGLHRTKLSQEVTSPLLHRTPAYNRQNNFEGVICVMRSERRVSKKKAVRMCL